eukprot:COSAG04_NODE_4780_length_1897_cov_4.299221_1_plen_152_part_10
MELEENPVGPAAPGAGPARRRPFQLPAAEDIIDDDVELLVPEQQVGGGRAERGLPGGARPAAEPEPVAAELGVEVREVDDEAFLPPSSRAFFRRLQQHEAMDMVPEQVLADVGRASRGEDGPEDCGITITLKEFITGNAFQVTLHADADIAT